MKKRFVKFLKKVKPIKEIDVLFTEKEINDIEKSLGKIVLYDRILWFLCGMLIGSVFTVILLLFLGFR